MARPTRNTPDIPTREQVVDLLARAGWSGYRAAELIDMSESALAQITRGETKMRATAWQLLKVHASQSVRDALPPAPLP